METKGCKNIRVDKVKPGMTLIRGSKDAEKKVIDARLHPRYVELLKEYEDKEWHPKYFERYLISYSDGTSDHLYGGTTVKCKI